MTVDRKRRSASMFRVRVWNGNGDELRYQADEKLGTAGQRENAARKIGEEFLALDQSKLLTKTRCRCGRCPTGFHTAGSLGSIPRLATYRGWASAHSGLISRNCRAQPPDPPLTKRPGTQTGKAVTLRAWRFCGFDSHSGHWQHDPVVQRRRRLRDMQESDGSIPSGITFDNWSVSVVAARCCGKAEDRVQFPDGPL